MLCSCPKKNWLSIQWGFTVASNRDVFFSNMNSDILYNHILSHKSKDKEHICDICNMIFDYSGQLSDHISKAYTLGCILCNSSAFLSRQALIDHSKLCQSADLNEKAGITSNAGVYNDVSPI